MFKNQFKKEVLTLSMLYPIIFILIGYSILLYENNMSFFIDKFSDFKLTFNTAVQLFLFTLAIPRVGFVGTGKLPSLYQRKIIWLITPMVLCLGILII